MEISKPAQSTSTTSGSKEITDLISRLPKQVWFEKYDVYQWRGYWYSPHILERMLTAQSHFKARDDDIIITSSPKSGTTWLKALVPTIINIPQTDDDDPLSKNNPHDVVGTLEIYIFGQDRIPDLSSMPSPRIFHTHMPYSELPDSVKKSKCKLVYVARNPKDVLISLWHFCNSMRTPEQGPFPMVEVFESFCTGVHTFGPIFDHVLEYWNESLNSPEKILFLKYEDMKVETKEQVKKLALFLGKALVSDEQVESVLRRCSIERLRDLEINKNGGMMELGIPNHAFFRNGTVGDWKKSFTAEMQERIDEIVRVKYEASGLHLQDLINNIT